LNEHGVKLTLSSTSQNLSGLGGIGALSRGVGHRGGFDSGGHYCLKFVLLMTRVVNLLKRKDLPLKSEDPVWVTV
jgi:hypothetical protein